MAKQYDLGVRVVSRYGVSHPATGLFSADDVRDYLEEKVKLGWRLMGQPQFTGMEDHLDQRDAGARLLFFWERGE